MHDTLADGRPFRVLTVVDNWGRQSPMLEVGLRMLGETVGQVLDRVLTGVSGPRSITGPSFNHERSKIGPIVGAVQLTSFDRVNPWKMPYSSLGHLTPNEFVAQRQVIWAAKEPVCSS